MSAFFVRHTAIDAELFEIARTHPPYVRRIDGGVGRLDFQRELIVNVHTADDSLPFKRLFHRCFSSNTPDEMVMEPRAREHRLAPLERDFDVGKLSSVKRLTRGYQICYRDCASALIRSQP